LTRKFGNSYKLAKILRIFASEIVWIRTN